MAYRILDSDVRAVVETDPNIAMLPFIAAAEALTNYVVAQDAANQLTPNLSTDTVFAIEQWLAAHFYSVRDQPYQQKSTSTGGGNASATFQGQTKRTRFWDTAKLIDTSGTLARLDKEAEEGGHPKVGLMWLGKSRRTNESGIPTPNRTY